MAKLVTVPVVKSQSSAVPSCLWEASFPNARCEEQLTIRQDRILEGIAFVSALLRGRSFRFAQVDGYYESNGSNGSSVLGWLRRREAQISLPEWLLAGPREGYVKGFVGPVKSLHLALYYNPRQFLTRPVLNWSTMLPRSFLYLLCISGFILGLAAALERITATYQRFSPSHLHTKDHIQVPALLASSPSHLHLLTPSPRFYGFTFGVTLTLLIHMFDSYLVILFAATSSRRPLDSLAGFLSLYKSGAIRPLWSSEGPVAQRLKATTSNDAFSPELSELTRLIGMAPPSHVGWDEMPRRIAASTRTKYVGISTSHDDYFEACKLERTVLTSFLAGYIGAFSK